MVFFKWNITKYDTEDVNTPFVFFPQFIDQNESYLWYVQSKQKNTFQSNLYV